jgi:hypothetical protein
MPHHSRFLTLPVLAIANHVHRPLQHGFQILLDPDQCEQIRMCQFDDHIDVTLIAKLIARGRAKDTQADDAKLVAPVSLEFREQL